MALPHMAPPAKRGTGSDLGRDAHRDPATRLDHNPSAPAVTQPGQPGDNPVDTRPVLGQGHPHRTVRPLPAHRNCRARLVRRHVQGEAHYLGCCRLPGVEVGQRPPQPGRERGTRRQHGLTQHLGAERVLRVGVECRADRRFRHGVTERGVGLRPPRRVVQVAAVRC